MTLTQKKLMSSAQAMEFLPADDSTLAADESDLQAVIPGLPDGFFALGVSEGWLHVTDITVDGIPLYRIYWQTRVSGKYFHVAASIFIGDRHGGKADTDVWKNGTEMLARKNGCKKITFCTMRRAHIEHGLAWGAKIVSVNMEKDL